MSQVFQAVKATFNTKALLLGFVVMSCAANVFALDKRPPVQFLLGTSFLLSDGSGPIEITPLEFSSKKEDKSKSFSGADGYNFSLGMSIYNFVEFDFTYAFVGSFLYQPVGKNITIDQLEVSSKFTWPYSSNLDGYVKIGVASWNGSKDDRISINGETDFSGTDVFWGVGFRIIAKKKAFFLEYLTYDYELASGNNGTITTDTLSGGIQIRF